MEYEKYTLHSFYHFSYRLKSRYGVVINYAEYLECCNTKILLLYKVSRNKRFGILNIKGKDVWVIKSNVSKNLITCLSRRSALPVPICYKKKGITQEQFHRDLKFAIITCQIVKSYFIASNMDYEQMFSDRPFNLPTWVYSIVYGLLKPRKNSHIVNNSTNILVGNLYHQKIK